jgi:hypothetical protein
MNKAKLKAQEKILKNSKDQTFLKSKVLSSEFMTYIYSLEYKLTLKLF